ncbi:MAG: hypothetical protein FWE36_07975 [Erysipelotrichales bacterium]|nr:hypothetical protein [Erysipelotrichales bacterium]
MLDWLNENNGFIIALLTFIYVLTTILILIANRKTTKLSQNQLIEMKNQNFEMNRGVLIARFQEIDNKLILSFENIGKSLIQNAHISISKEFFESFEENQWPKIKLLIENSTKQKHYFAPNQILNYFVYKLTSGDDFYQRLKNTTVYFEFNYETLDQKITEKTCINLNPILASFYGLNFEEIMTNKVTESIDLLTKEIKEQNRILAQKTNQKIN